MTRLVTALLLILVAGYLIGWSPEPAYFVAALLMSCLCYWEYAGLVAGHGIAKPGIFGFIMGAVILFVPSQALLGASLVLIGAFIVSLRRDNLREVLPQVAAMLMGAVYAFAPWHFSVELRRVSVHLLFFALALNWVGDSAAYYVGRTIGKHKLAPVVSPGKSWEGAAASVLGSVLFGLLYLPHFVPQLRGWQIVLIAIAANVAGQFGDLAESAMKRGAGVKDSGNLLPGHGGMLDRVDSSLFALPIVYALYQCMVRVFLFK